MSTIAPDRPQTDEVTPAVVIRPTIEINEDLQKKINDFALAYALGEYNDMENYTINLGRNARSLGMSYNQFVTELIDSLWLLTERIKFDRSPVVALLMSR